MTEDEIKHQIAHGQGYAGLLLGVGAFSIAKRLGMQHETMLEIIRDLLQIVDSDEKRGQISSIAARTARYQLERALGDALTRGQSQNSPKQ